MAEAKNIRLYAPDGARIEDASLAADYLAAEDVESALGEIAGKLLTTGTADPAAALKALEDRAQKRKFC